MTEGDSTVELKKKKGYDRLVSDIILRLEETGFDERDLDEMIHDIAAYLGTEAANREESDDTAGQLIDLWFKAASSLNNEGIESQVRAILWFHGIRGSIEQLNTAFAEDGFHMDVPVLTPGELCKEDLESVVSLIIDALYLDETGQLQWGREWDEENIERVAEVLHTYALAGQEEK